MLFVSVSTSSGHFVPKSGVGRGTGAFIYALSADETSPALAAPRHAITALFSCCFKCACPFLWQPHFRSNADRAYNRQGVSNVGTDAAVDTVTTAAADTAAGTWELVSMTYNGMTVGKEDLEEMGTAMTLDLLEDGVLMLANADTEMVFERPGSVAAVTAPDEEEGEQTASSTAASVEDSWTVVPLASAQALVPYSCTEFSMNIPEGWSVKSSAMYTGMFHAIHVFDPENPVNQIFFMLKMEPLFSDEISRAMMALSSDLFGKCPILTNVPTQGVFEIFPQFADAMNATADYADIQTPYIADFSVTESFESTQGMSSVAISPSILRADFTQNGTTGE